MLSDAEFDAKFGELASLRLSPSTWYRVLRRYGTVSHAGFGVGFERLVM